MARFYLLVLSEREAVAWVLGNRRMAFPAGRSREAYALRPGDELLLYTTRGCYHNPMRDRGRVIGLARVATAASELGDPIRIAGREFPIGCDLSICAVAPVGAGVVLSKLVSQLRVFPDPRSWGIRLRRALVPLPRDDARLLIRNLTPSLSPLSEVLDGYLAAGRPVRRAAARNRAAD